MPTHYMTLDEPWFNLVQDGVKSYELRLWDSKRKSVKVNDHITFTNRQTGEKCTKKVVGFISGFTTFRSVFNTFDYELVVPGVKNIDEACQIYYDIPGYKEGIKEHKAVVYKLVNI